MFEQLLLVDQGITTPGPVGQMTWITPGTYEWVVPDDVTTVCVAILGAGSRGYISGTNAIGGRGGGLRFQNNINVTPGETIQVVVGDAGVDTLTSTSAIANNYSDATLLSSAFGIEAGPYALGSNYTTIAIPTTTAPTRVGGTRGGTAGSSSNLSKGGSAATFVPSANGEGFTGDVAPNQGIDIITGVMGGIAGTSPNMGRVSGGGGSALYKTNNGGTNNQGWRGGHGAVRIIWGNNRWYPDRNISDQ